MAINIGSVKHNKNGGFLPGIILLYTIRYRFTSSAETVECASRTVEDGDRERLWSGCEPKPVSVDQMCFTRAAQSPRAHEAARKHDILRTQLLCAQILGLRPGSVV